MRQVCGHVDFSSLVGNEEDCRGMDVDGTYSLQHLLSNWSLDVGFHHPAPTLLYQQANRRSTLHSFRRGLLQCHPSRDLVPLRHQNITKTYYHSKKHTTTHRTATTSLPFHRTKSRDPPTRLLSLSDSRLPTIYNLRICTACHVEFLAPRTRHIISRPSTRHVVGHPLPSVKL